MEKQQSVIYMIHLLYDNFYEQEKKIADYILGNHKEVVNMTIGELAKACKTSVATVSRFCKKCNMDGFHHLKISLAKEITNGDTKIPVSNTISKDDIGQSLQNILANKVEELKQTISFIDEEQLKMILESIEKAQSVHFVAVGGTLPVALDGAFKLNQIGIPAVASTIWETQLAMALSMTNKDVMIAISNSGESKKVVQVIREAKKRGALTIGITNNANSTVGNTVDFHIQTATMERLFLNEFCFSRVSATVVIEILYLFLTVGQKHSYDKVREFEDLIAEEKL